MIGGADIMTRCIRNFVEGDVFHQKGKVARVWFERMNHTTILKRACRKDRIPAYICSDIEKVRVRGKKFDQCFGFARLPYTVSQNVLRNENIAFSVHLHFKGWHTIKFYRSLINRCCGQVQSSYQLDLENFIPPTRLGKVF